MKAGNQIYGHPLTYTERKRALQLRFERTGQAIPEDDRAERVARYKRGRTWTPDTEQRIDAIVRAASLPGYSARNPAPFVERVLEEMMA
jgi:hypothetical protein